MTADGSSWVTVPDQTGMSSLLIVTSRYSMVGLSVKSMCPLVYVKCIYECEGADGRLGFIDVVRETVPFFVFVSLA